VLARGERRITLVDERRHLVTQIVHVAPDARRVQKLGAADRGPGVDEYDDGVGTVAGGEHLVDSLDHRRVERRALCPRVRLAAVALDQVHRRDPRTRPADPGRAVDEQRAARGVAKRVVREDFGLDDELVQRALERAGPGRRRSVSHLCQRHPRTVANPPFGGEEGEGIVIA
jgi:hypothetical protein